MKININGITREMTPEEEAEYNIPITAEERIEQLKQLLALSDYKAIKYAEGLISEEEYTPIKAQREAWREEIRRWENDS